MRKAMLALVCLAMLFSMVHGAYAMTYVGKVGSTLNVNPNQKGNGDQRFHFDATDNLISAQFHRSGSWNVWYYNLSSNVTSDDNFFARFDFKSPPDWDWTQSGGGGSAHPYIFFGFLDTDNPNSGWTSEVALHIYDYETGMDIESWLMGQNALYGSGWNDTHMIATSTNCYVTLSYNASTKKLTVELYEAGSLTGTYVSTLGGGDSFNENAVGLYTYAPNDGNSAYLTYPINVTKIIVNTGVTEESFNFGVKSSSSYNFNLSDGTDITTNGQTGVKTVYAWNISAGKPVGSVNIDFSAPSETVVLPPIVSGSDATAGIALFHNLSAYPIEALNWWLLVPKTIGGLYHCQFAALLSDVNTSCPGVDLNPSYTIVNLGEQDYYNMSNQGGGNGGIICGVGINDPRCFNVTIGNATLQVYDTMCYDETNGKSTNVTLNAFSTMKVLCNATVYHGEGCQAFNGTLAGNSLEGKFFDSTKDNTTCTANSTKNCILNSSCAAVSTCSVDGMNQTVECQYTMYYNANNTTWTGWMNVTDIHGTMGYNDSTIPVENLNALNVTNSTLNLGTLAPGANTSTHTNGTNIENGGNIKIDLNLNGTSVFTCPTPPNIGIGNLSYNLSSAAAYGITALTATATPLNAFNLDSAAGSVGVPTATNKYLYWGMGMPMSTVGGQTCSATIRIAAIMDQ